MAPADADMPIGTGEIPPRFSTLRRVGFWLLVMLVTMSPLVVTVRSDEEAWFAWRMFSVVNGSVEYEVRHDGEWRATDINDLGRWDRGRHLGTENLDALCDLRPEVAAARRLIDGDVDAEVDCR